MKFNLALPSGVIVLASATAVASQPAQNPAGPKIQPAKAQPKPGLTRKARPPIPKAEMRMRPCDKANKSANGDTKPTHPSAKVGKDTGDPPPPRKKAPSDATCRTKLQ